MPKPQNRTEYLVVTLPWIIIILGLLGNTFSAIVMLRKRFRNRNIGVYLLALAILDTIFLLSNTLFHWGIEILSGKNIQTYSDFGCGFVKYVIVASRAMSAWILVMLTVQRMLALAVPQLAKSLNTKRQAIITTTVVVIVQGIMYTYDFKVNGVRYEETIYCYWTADIVEKKLDIIFNIFDYVNYALIPSVAMATSNSVLICLLKHSQELQSSRGGTDLRSITILIVITNITFIVLTMPMTIFQILYVAGVTTGPDYDYPILYSLDLLNHAVNFLLYCVSESHFRDEVRVIFTCCCKRPRNGTERSDMESNELGSQPHVYTNNIHSVDCTKNNIHYPPYNLL